ncbi:MAG: glycosyl hydrolase-related protein [Thermoguttaceae bacterium]|nr:glycosyl hydrolase-related protein [Thermoguttaceae bacterium]MDW8077293.1 glycoside hydrolase family 38 C-terminal domain-containing protein [Thermoguttaceae bacterium]
MYTKPHVQSTSRREPIAQQRMHGRGAKSDSSPILRTSGKAKCPILPLPAVVLGLAAVASCYSAVAKAEGPSSGRQSGQSPALQIKAIESTVFHVRKNGQLFQLAELILVNGGDPTEAELVFRLGENSWKMNLGTVPSGQSRFPVELPRVEKPTQLTAEIATGGKIQATVELTWRPSHLWQVCLVPISHHDLGYTDTLENVLSFYERVYDQVLQFCEQTDDYPEEAKFRYTIEGAWSLEHYLRQRPPEVTEKFGYYLRQGRIELQALYGNLITNLLSHEEQIRALYPSFAIKRRFGAEITTASTTDIPGLSWGLPTVLAGSGVRYFFAGLATYFEWGRSDIHTFWDEKAILRRGRPDAFWWEGPDGGRVLVYYQGGYGCWSPGSYEEAAEHLPRVLKELEQQGTPFSVIRFGGYGCGDNTPPNIVPSMIVREWNSRWAYPRLYVATNAMFFEMLEAQCRNQPDLRAFRGEIPETDYVVGATSTARETTLNRLSHVRLPVAERWATVAARLLGADYPAQALAEAFNNMLLYDEHTWGMAHPIGRRQDWSWADKARYAYRAAGLAETVLSSRLRMFAEATSRPEEGYYVVVFNPLSFPRSDIVRVTDLGPLADGLSWENSLILVDLSTGKKVSAQLVEVDSPLAAQPDAAFRYGRGQFSPAEKVDLVFFAEDVPALGWKTYRVLGKAGLSEAGEKVPDGWPGPATCELENRFYRLGLDPQTGSILTLVDKELDREIIDGQAGFGINQLVVKDIRTGKLTSTERVSIVPGQRGPVLQSLRILAEAGGCPRIIQEVSLYRDIKRVDLATRLLRDATSMLELYFAFPFKIDNAQFAFEASNSVIVPFRDQLPGTNTNYYAAQHWVAAWDGSLTAVICPIESHLIELGGLWPCYVSQAHHGVTAPDFGLPFVQPEQMKKGHIFSFVHASNFRTNFPVIQQADLLYRFSMTTLKTAEGLDRPARFGWEVAYPLEAVVVQGKSEGELKVEQTLCRIEPDHVALLALKQAEDGRGFILRVGEIVGKACRAQIDLTGLGLVATSLTNLVEEDLEDIRPASSVLQLSLRPFQRVTIRLERK